MQTEIRNSKLFYKIVAPTSLLFLLIMFVAISTTLFIIPDWPYEYVGFYNNNLKISAIAISLTVLLIFSISGALFGLNFNKKVNSKRSTLFFTIIFTLLLIISFSLMIIGLIDKPTADQNYTFKTIVFVLDEGSPKFKYNTGGIVLITLTAIIGTSLAPLIVLYSLATFKIKK
ncbi:hypothetical protein FACS1894218_6450 [Bacilli bacterium]|nr:hypothetical protein FACS1894218_6450 [Bacilli bacterium]